MSQPPYQPPIFIESTDECNFYHTIDIPGIGLVEGQWDLRSHVEEYLGGFGFRDRRVLEIGPATGFLTFEMEKRGAEVVVVEPPMDREFWNSVPYDSLGLLHRESGAWTPSETAFFDHIRMIRNGFWYCHRVYGSRARMFHGSAERLPPELGSFDAALLTAVLLHTRSPVSILESCARRVSGSMIVTERHFPELGEGPVCSLVPTVENQQWDTWWQFTPRFFTQFFEVLGFSRHRVTFHTQRAFNHELPMFTVVAERG